MFKPFKYQTCPVLRWLLYSDLFHYLKKAFFVQGCAVVCPHDAEADDVGERLRLRRPQSHERFAKHRSTTKVR